MNFVPQIQNYTKQFLTRSIHQDLTLNKISKVND